MRMIAAVILLGMATLPYENIELPSLGRMLVRMRTAYSLCVGEPEMGAGVPEVTLDSKSLKCWEGPPTNPATEENWEAPVKYPWIPVLGNPSVLNYVEARRYRNGTSQLVTEVRISKLNNMPATAWIPIGIAGEDNRNSSYVWVENLPTRDIRILDVDWQGDKTDYWYGWRRRIPEVGGMVGAAPPYPFDNQYFYAEAMVGLVYNMEIILPVAYNMLNNTTLIRTYEVTDPGPPKVTQQQEQWRPNGTNGPNLPRWDGAATVYNGQFLVLRPQNPPGQPQMDTVERIIGGVFLGLPVTPAYFAGNPPSPAPPVYRRVFQDEDDEGELLEVNQDVHHYAFMTTMFRVCNSGGQSSSHILCRMHWGIGRVMTIGDLPPGGTTSLGAGPDFQAANMGWEPPEMDMDLWNHAVQAGACDFARNIQHRTQNE